MDRMVPRVVSLDKCVFSNMTLFLKEQLQNASEKSISSHNCVYINTDTDLLETVCVVKKKS